MIHVPRHHNIEVIAKYRTVAESLFHGSENTQRIHWIGHGGEGPSHAGQLRTVCILSLAMCEVTVYLCCELA
jgi:hypothetical protein